MSAWRLIKPPLHPSLDFQIVNHRFKVKSLYKRSLQQIENLYGKLGM